MRPERWGLESTYRDASGVLRRVRRESLDALLAALAPEGEEPPPSSVVSVRAGGRWSLHQAAEVVTEDGRTMRLDHGFLPAELPLGYHRVVWRDGRPPARLVVSPVRCQLPGHARAWGWALQLYALRSRESWGMGDLGDLDRLMSWSATLGAGMTLVNPLHAVHAGTPQQASPYFPSSRLWRNPLYLTIHEVPGADDIADDIEPFRVAALRLNERRRLDRDTVYVLKMKALERLWERGRADDGFTGFVSRHGAALEGFSTYTALSERFGRDWRAWPSEYRHPDGPAVARFRRDNRERVGFHAWIQWLLDRQIERAAGHGGLIQDLAVGVDPSGADAWQWQQVFASRASIGAPPDAFNSAGQSWGVIGFDPWRLRDAEYEPFVQMLRSSLGRNGGLRMDHIMGLWRLFLIPEGGSPGDGAYLRFPTSDLLDIVALESHRAGAYIIGEDLGTVPPGVREEMNARDILSSRLMWFEETAPAGYPPKALAAVSNHDLPTVAGIWSGADLRAQEEMGRDADVAAHEALRARLREVTGAPPGAPVSEVVRAAYEALATAPSVLLAATLEDALEVPDRHNHPGTTDEWPNWSLALPLPLESIERHPATVAIAAALSRRDVS